MNLNKMRKASLQFKISSIYIVTNLLILVMNMVLLGGINSMSTSLDMVYQDNLHLNELTDALGAVQTI